MNLKENLPLVQVEYQENGKKVVLTFLDEEMGEICDVQFNKQKYDNGKYVDDPDRAAKTEQKVYELTGCSFDNLSSLVGAGFSADVYCYDKFNSLEPVSTIQKFDKSMNGKSYMTKVDDIIMDDIAIRVRYTIDNKQYETKYTFAKYLEDMKKWFVNPIDKVKKLEKFEKTFGVPFNQKDSLIGNDVIIIVKSAFGKCYYGEIAPRG